MEKEVQASVFIKVVEEQLDTYKELLDLAEKKGDVLVKGDVKLLGAITKTEQDLVLRLGKLEEERSKLIAHIANIYDKDISEVKIDFLIDIFDDEQTKTLTSINDEFKSVLTKIEVKNRRNEELIKNALDYINFSVKLLTDAGEMKTSYSADGVNSKKVFHIIDKKA